MFIIKKLSYERVNIISGSEAVVSGDADCLVYILCGGSAVIVPLSQGEAHEKLEKQDVK